MRFSQELNLLYSRFVRIANIEQAALVRDGS